MRSCLIGLLVLAAVPVLTAQQTAPPAIAGNWTATFADSVTSGTLSITLQTDANGAISGAYKASSGGFGTVAGELNGLSFQFTLTQTMQACPGTFAGMVTFSGDHGTGTFSGKDCLGTHERGVISFARANKAENPTANPSKQAPPTDERYSKFRASLPPGTFWWGSSDCSYCRYLYASGVPFEVLVAPDVTVAATMGRHGSLWYGSIIVIDEGNGQIDVLRKLLLLRLTRRKGNGEESTFAKIISPDRIARQRGRRFALAFFSALAMSAPSYSQSNIYGSATTSGYSGTSSTTFNGTASTYTYGGANKVLAYANYLRRLAAIRERADWIESASFKDTSIFQGQSTQGLLWFKGEGDAAVAELMTRIGGKTFVFGWVNSGHH